MQKYVFPECEHLSTVIVLSLLLCGITSDWLYKQHGMMSLPLTDKE